MWFKKKSKPSVTEQAKLNAKPPPPKSASTDFVEVLSCAHNVNQLMYAMAAMMYKHGPVKINPDGESWSNSAGKFMTKYEVTFIDGSSVSIKLP